MSFGRLSNTGSPSIAINRVFERVFRPVYGLPCWGVQPGCGSFLTLEFGEPHLRIREPIDSENKVPLRVKRHLARRRVFVKGQWHLWIYCCDWSVYENGKVKGDSTSRRRIRRAAEVLDGQKLTSVTITPRGCRSVFKFDLGARLETKPFDRKSEQWMFFQLSGKILTLRADKKYSHIKSNTQPNFEQWRPIVKEDAS